MCFWQTKPNTAPTPPRPTPQSPVVLQHPGGQGPLYNPQPYLSSYISQIHSVPVRKPKINKHGHLRRLSLNVVLNTFYKDLAGIWNMPIKSQIFTWNCNRILFAVFLFTLKPQFLCSPVHLFVFQPPQMYQYTMSTVGQGKYPRAKGNCSVCFLYCFPHI